MNSMLLRAAIWLVHRWTDLYTSGLPVSLREARRAEIVSDVWHTLHDPDHAPARRVALQLILRVVLGIPDDLAWRREQITAPLRPRMRAALAGCVLGLFALAVTSPFWRPPPPPAVPALHARPAVGAAYPPPPPPPPVHGTTESREPAPVLQYGQASYTVTTNAVAPIKIKDVPPVYPPIAVSNDVEGVVVVQATITDAGRVADARVIQSASFLTQAALDAVRQWEFATTDHGAPVSKTLTVRVKFARPDRRETHEGK